MSPSGIRSRQIEELDLARIIDLLSAGFPERSRAYWHHAVDALSAHGTPPGLPRYGYLLEHDGLAVGVILLIFSEVPGADGRTLRCNVSSWYVEPAFRTYASLLIAHALKYKHVTYVNISPSPHTRRTVEAQGFSPYSTGELLAIPALSREYDPAAQVLPLRTAPQAVCDPVERTLLEAHARHGCLCLWCVSAGRAIPFVFTPRRIRHVLPTLQLAYCPDIGDFVRCARPLGRYLLKRGRPFVVVDTDGPIEGLAGWYFAGKSCAYYRGPRKPSFGDLTYTEAVLFGR
ncbi:MAG: acyl-CoA acyltransferase [Hyphomicrobiales bacterium]|nr:acyl-CoA acyltransferase [Hyphomicrobiales bacterium]